MANPRKWFLLGVVLLLLAAFGAWAYSSPRMQARYAAYRLKNSADAAAKAPWADRLVALGPAGLPYLLEDPAAAAAVERALAPLPDNDPRAVALAGQVLDAAQDEPSRRALLELMPLLLRKAGAAHAARCREVVAAGLHSPELAARLAAVRLAMHPRLDLQAQLLPLLHAPEAELRRAVLFAVGPAADADHVLGDEELFHWLHDPDAPVRAICQEALASRGRTEAEIALGRRLTHPEVGERLALVLDLRFEDDDVRDPEPWLERLSRDADPAVRAGAARVAVERHLLHASWVGRLAERDPNATVRQIAGYYRAQLEGTAVRAVSGP